MLDSVVVYMKAVPAVKLELSSHTDCRGSDDYNQKLSQRRAQSCVDYIIATGISKDRIVPKGMVSSGFATSVRMAYDAQRRSIKITGGPS